MQIFDEVKKIEQEAADLELDYQNKLRKLEQNTQDKIGEMKRNIEKELATFQINLINSDTIASVVISLMAFHQMTLQL